MPRFRKKPVVIEAVQWFPGIFVEGVTTTDPMVVYSRDSSFFYVTMGDFMPTYWLEVQRRPGALPEEHRKEGNVFERSWVETKLKSTGETFHRQALPFAFFEVKSGERKPVAITDDLFLDYMSIWGSETLPEITGWVDTLEGRMKVSPGDWVITGVKGERYPCRADIFAVTYEQVE